MDGSQRLRPTRFRSPAEWQVILNNALPEFTCGACGNQDWDALGPGSEDGGENLVGLLHLVDFRRESLAAYVGSVGFACRNCGKIELFLEKYLLQKAGLTDGK